MQKEVPTVKKQAYTAKQIDILVVYIVAEDAWYVIPAVAFAPVAHLRFYPSGKYDGWPYYEKYREAWNLMKARSKQELNHSSVLGRLLPR